MTDFVSPTLDRIEKSLPAVPRAWLRLNRAVLRTGCHVAESAWRRVSERSTNVASATGESTRTVSGQIRAQVDRVSDTATSGARVVAGQASAETAQAARSMERETAGLLDDAAEAIEEMPDYEDATRADLYKVAQERDVDGRSSMDKQELIEALRGR